MQFTYITVAVAAVATNVFAAPVQNEAEAVKIIPRAVNSAHYANQVNQINQHLTKAGVQIRNGQYCIGPYFNSCYNSYRTLFTQGCDITFFGDCGPQYPVDWRYLLGTYPNLFNYGYLDGCNALSGWIGCGNSYIDPILYKKDVSSADVHQQEE